MRWSTIKLCSICGGLFDTVFGCGQNHDAWITVPYDPENGPVRS